MVNRTVFDTNIWISYFLSEKFDELIKLRRENSVLFLRSLPSMVELKNVVSRKKFQKNNFNVDKLMRFYVGISTFCATTVQFNDCTDPKDNFLFDLAIQGKADFLVSGDKKVLGTPLESKSVQIRSLSEFKASVLTSKNSNG